MRRVEGRIFGYGRAVGGGGFGWVWSVCEGVGFRGGKRL